MTIGATMKADGLAFNILKSNGKVSILDGQSEQLISIDQIKEYLSKFEQSASVKLFNTTDK